MLAMDSKLLALACLGIASGATCGDDADCLAASDELSALQFSTGQLHNHAAPQPCGDSKALICEEPFVLCAQAKCLVSAFNNPPGGLAGLNVAYCNCSYMGKTMSAGTNWASPEHPAAYTNKPFENVCEYMRELPKHGYVLSTFTNQRTEYNWPVPDTETAAYSCASDETVTAQCDGAVCQVMDGSTWTPKLDQSTWVAGDPAVCTCPTVQGPDQVICGALSDEKCGTPGYPGGPGCVPVRGSSWDTYEVMVGAIPGGASELASLIQNCTGLSPPAGTSCPAE